MLKVPGARQMAINSSEQKKPKYTQFMASNLTLSLITSSRFGGMGLPALKAGA